MNKLLLFVLVLGSIKSLSAQYATVPNTAGTTAIKKDSSIIEAWATGIEIQRGYLDINDKSVMLSGSNKVNFGDPSEGLYAAEGNSSNIVSLGDSGIAIVNFASTIYNGVGPDFAVYENGFANDYIELAFVEVSSDGIHYVRFPASSLYQTTTQVGNYDFASCESVNNLAGKYRQGYGTPFDLEELKDSANLDVNAISHIKLVDVIGSITNIGSIDTAGNRINDCYPTPFASGGFDLDAVATMHMNPLRIDENQLNSVSVYPNPTKGNITIHSFNNGEIKLSDLSGTIVFQQEISNHFQIDLSSFSNSILVGTFNDGLNVSHFKIVIEQ
ncbi:MAG: T9SS type A sorting domain-containing protein [Fluviicola sp.]|jgi:hypothetical protein|nr:T9SS type A sorting domain-containing protein [Fluviicola sp.]